MKTLHDVPAVIEPFLNDVHFFPGILPHIPSEQPFRGAIEREFPRVTQSVDPDFAFGIRVADKRIIRRNHIGRAGIDVNSQNFSQECTQVLSIAKRIAA